jgi:hypothetical protein
MGRLLLILLLACTTPSSASAQDGSFASEKQLLGKATSYKDLLCENHGKDSELCVAASAMLALSDAAELKIALIGVTGAGKSTLARTLLGYGSKEKKCIEDKSQCPQECMMGECTGVKEDWNKHGFSTPGAPHLRIHDLPGCGGETWTPEKWLRSHEWTPKEASGVGLERFNAAIFVTSKRFTSCDGAALRKHWHLQTQYVQRPVFYVVNVSDRDWEMKTDDGYVPLSADLKAKRTDDFRREAHASITEALKKGDKKYNSETPLPSKDDVFVLSAPYMYRNKHDLPKLKQRILASMSDLLETKVRQQVTEIVKGRKGGSASHAIIHTMATASSGLAFSCSQLPGVSRIPITAMQVFMGLALAHVHEIELSTASMVSMMGSASAMGTGLLVSTASGASATTAAAAASHAAATGLYASALAAWNAAAAASTAACAATGTCAKIAAFGLEEVAGMVPGWGNFLKGGTTLAVTETMGWTLDSFFARCALDKSVLKKAKATAEGAKEGVSWLGRQTLAFVNSPPGKCMQKQLSALGLGGEALKAAGVVPGKLAMLALVPQLLKCFTNWTPEKEPSEADTKSEIVMKKNKKDNKNKNTKKKKNKRSEL